MQLSNAEGRDARIGAGNDEPPTPSCVSHEGRVSGTSMADQHGEQIGQQAACGRAMPIGHMSIDVASSFQFFVFS